MVVATSNAVNFTDGLDGLAIGALISNALIFGVLSYIVGHMNFANYLFIPYVAGAGELTIFCFSLIGAGLAFLWFNSYPAEVFMGRRWSFSFRRSYWCNSFISKARISSFYKWRIICN